MGVGFSLFFWRLTVIMHEAGFMLNSFIASTKKFFIRTIQHNLASEITHLSFKSETVN